MRKLLFIACGWIALVAGLLIMPLPFPLPFPVGPVLVLVGCAILTTHSKRFRRWLQHMRHRHAWLDKTMLFFSHRSPRSVRVMVHRTRPLAIVRHLRLRLRRRARNQDAQNKTAGAAK